MKTIRWAGIAMAIWCMAGFAPSTAAGEPAPEDRPIIVGGNSNYPPYEFIGKDGQPAGFNIDLTRAVAKVMGMNVQIRLGTYEERIMSLAEGRIDAMGGFSYSDERATLFDFSPPHTIINLAIFGRNDSPPLRSLEGLRGKKILVMAGGRMQGLLREKGFGDSLVFTDTYANGLRLLASAKYDYMFMGTLPAIYLIKEYGLSNIVVIREVDHQRYCFAVRKGNRELLAKFSEGLAIVKKTGQYDEIYGKWLGVLEPAGVPWNQVIRIGSILTGLFLAILLGALLWSRTLQKKVAQRTASLALEVKERQRAEEELRRNHEQLMQASKMAAIGTLVSGVAHEINNPNGLILLNTSMLADMHDDLREVTEERYKSEGDFPLGKWRYSEVRENLEQMLTETIEASKRIGRIVEDLKNFSRPGSSGLDEPVDLNAVAKAALRLMDNNIKKFTDSFLVRYAGELPRIRGNAQRVEQVIVNLLLNACQALPDRSRSVTLTTRLNREDRMVELEIADEGIGIAPDQLQYVTDPFYTTKRDRGGTGLGLSVSAAIVKEHGGRLVFRSTPGKGTTVTLSLPVAEKGALS
ncbi:MAG: transporter substrate-binding domain-containing protein [Deltaproteobacteria bacterium]|nr:transporter substrate-binding domain-containing protein [Deltaproteobacteria bacterium]